MIANEEYKAALADMKNFCAKETTFDVEFLTNVYPLVAVFKPKAQRSLFDSENYNVDENGEIGSIQIAFGTTTKVQSSLRFKMDAKLLKKFIKLTEKVGLLYLHAFFENQAAGTYEAWQAAQADAALKAAAIKQTAEDARSGEQNAEYRVEVYVYDLLENSKPNLSDLDYTLTGSFPLGVSNQFLGEPAQVSPRRNMQREKRPRRQGVHVRGVQLLRRGANRRRRRLRNVERLGGRN